MPFRKKTNDEEEIVLSEKSISSKKPLEVPKFDIFSYKKIQEEALNIEWVIFNYFMFIWKEISFGININ